ncbi:M61 family metallopeptidase [Rhizobacter sp. OV335]|uniref:M61 family metallopeptidase n=1 Tax=Rhizobacter sp. OV335 TaxID=1500264 RepID=UPI0009113811|nr:M61 family metallopeptidase [Rhizobacter sp. OV335]SHL92963.1 Predicted metalloprotease, contains C-terminal PDZ domain [Rhizobacter sp. OV335]
MNPTLRTVVAAISLATVVPFAAAQTLPALSDAPYPGVISLAVDATDLDRKIFRVRETIPVSPGPLALFYPRWLPGTHSPSAALAQLSGLQVSAGGKPVAWLRDAVDSAAFHVEVPTGVTSLDIEFQFLTPLEPGNERQVVTPDMLGVQWNAVVLYPAGHAAAKISVQPSLTLPAGWLAGTALELASQDAPPTGGATFSYKATDLDTLVDSPVFAGRHLQRLDLDPGARAAGRAPVFLNVVADRASQGVISPEQLAAHRALVTQADKVFASRHFTHYEFLLALSDQFGRIGLEHHQSSENGVKAAYFTEWAKGSIGRDLLPHEYTHSWNGKFRRPADLWTPHFNTPMRDSLLWVYEGQTQYWGAVLAARSGLVSAADARDDLAETAALLDARAGRAWRNLQDTTNEPLLWATRGRRDWTSWQRSADYYDESRLVWLEADMLIRERSNGKRSLDDFARAFFGAEPKRVQPLTYGFDDVVRELNRVQAYDWAGFLRQRLDTHDRPAPLGGIAAAGWKLAWSDKPSEHYKARMAAYKVADFNYSLGFDIGEAAKVRNVNWGSPAFDAGMAPGATLLAVNGRAYTEELLKEAVTAAKDGNPVELLLKSGDLYRSVRIAWRGGLRYPSLQRIDGTPDRLTTLFAPLR